MNLKAAKLRNKSDFFKKHFKAANQSQLLQASSMQSIGTLKKKYQNKKFCLATDSTPYYIEQTSFYLLEILLLYRFTHLLLQIAKYLLLIYF